MLHRPAVTALPTTRLAAIAAVAALATLAAPVAPIAAQSPAATIEPLASAAASAQPDPTLEAVMPDEIGGQPFEVTSGVGAAAFAGSSPEDQQQLTDFLAGFDRTVEDMSFAMGFSMIPSPSDPTDFRGLSIVAFRVRDVAGADLQTELVKLYLEQAGMPDAQAVETAIAGKPVVSIADPSSTDPTQSIFVRAAEDMVFLVGGTPDLVEEAIAKLP